MIKNLCLFMIRGYQFLFSPWVGHNCRFLPTCSPYSDSVPSGEFGLRFFGSSAAIPSEEAGLTKFLTNSSGIVGAGIVRIRNLRRIFFNLN